jgi:hypothetical protein
MRTLSTMEQTAMTPEKPKFAIVEDQDTNGLEAAGRPASALPTDEIIDPPQGEPMPPIDKPADDDDDVDLSRFEAKTTADIARVKTLLTGLPVLKPGEIKDYFVLHPGDGWWKRPPYCFIDVPVIGVAKSILHLIDENVAKRNLDAEDFFRFRLVLGSKPYDVFFFSGCRPRISTIFGTKPRCWPVSRPRTVSGQSSSARRSPAMSGTKSKSRKTRTPSQSRIGHHKPRTN